MFGTVAALSQLFVEVYPQDISDARAEHKKAKKLRDSNRVSAFDLLTQINESGLLNNELSSKTSSLILEHSVNQKNSLMLFEKLNKVKASHKINNFPYLRSFLDGIGMPIFVFVLALIFLVLYLLRSSLEWRIISNSFVFMSAACLFNSLIYLIWAFSPEMEISTSYYVTGLIIASIFSSLFLFSILKHLFKYGFTKTELVSKIYNIMGWVYDLDDKNYIKEEKRKEFAIDRINLTDEIV